MSQTLPELQRLAPVLVTGAGGQLGSAFCARLNGSGVVAATRSDLDISDNVATLAYVRNVAPRLIINCSAYNDVDGAESNPLVALRVNSEGAYNLALASALAGALLVHYSTDFVFDGTTNDPLTETDAPRPNSVYGMSKLLGERHVAFRAGRHYIVRLSSLYGGKSRRAFIDAIVERALAGRPVRAFVDRMVSPSYVPDVVNATFALAVSNASAGVYHCGSSTATPWYHLAGYILQRLGQLQLLEPLVFTEAAFRAKRPQHCALSIRKLQAVTDCVRPWKDAVDHYLSVLSVAPASEQHKGSVT